MFVGWDADGESKVWSKQRLDPYPYANLAKQRESGMLDRGERSELSTESTSVSPEDSSGSNSSAHSLHSTYDMGLVWDELRNWDTRS